jgi:HSP20 family protein
MCALRRSPFFEPALSMVRESVWRPAVDVRRTAGGWLIKAELAGVPSDQVQVVVRGNSVVLSGVRRDTPREDGASCYAMEIAYCRFERRIELPGPMEDAKLSVSSRDGLVILKIRIAKVSETP